MEPVTKIEEMAMTEDEVEQFRYKRVKKLGKKGYVRLRTTMGDLNVELHCDLVPESPFFPNGSNARQQRRGAAMGMTGNC